MTDTVQTRAQLVSALASTGEQTITAQTMRNWLISSPLLADIPGSIYVSATGSDATGARGGPAFATLNAAVAAAQSGDTIRIGVGTFAPLTVPIPSWVRIVGSGKPHLNSNTAPTALAGGTVIQGPLVAYADGFELWHAGVDCGSAVCAALYSSTPYDALVVGNVFANIQIGTSGSPTGTFTLTATNLFGTSTQTTAALALTATASQIQTALQALAPVGAAGVTVTGTAPNWLIQPASPWWILTVNTAGLSGGSLTQTTGHPTGVPPLNSPRLGNVIALGPGATAGTHAIRVENVTNSTIGSVEAYFASHCLAVKGTYITIANVITGGGGTTGFYIKGDNYAPTSYVNATNINIRPIGNSSSSAIGIAIAGLTGELQCCTVTNFSVCQDSTNTYGFQIGVQLNATSDCSHCEVCDGTVAVTSGDGVQLNVGCDDITISGVYVVGAGGNGFTIASVTRCSIVGSKAFACTGDGFNTDSGSDVNHSINFSGDSAFQNTGYGFNNPGTSTYTFGSGLVSEANTAGRFGGNAFTLAGAS